MSLPQSLVVFFILSFFSYFMRADPLKKELYLVNREGVPTTIKDEAAKDHFFSQMLVNEGVLWDTPGCIKISDGQSLLADFGEEIRFKNLLIQADNNDVYLAESVSFDKEIVPGKTLTPYLHKTYLTTYHETFENGVRSRAFEFANVISLRYLLITPSGGDHLYSVAALKAYTTSRPDWKKDLLIGPIWTPQLKEEVLDKAFINLELIFGLIAVCLVFFWIPSAGTNSSANEWGQSVIPRLSIKSFALVAIALIFTVAIYWYPLLRYIIVG